METSTWIALGGLLVNVIGLLGAACAISWRMGGLEQQVRDLVHTVGKIEKPNGYRFPECAANKQSIEDLGRRMSALEKQLQ